MHKLGHEMGDCPLLQVTPIVFVADDDGCVRESLELLTRCEGRQPETFASAREFLDHSRAPVPSCLILDISLPGLTCLDLQRLVAVYRTDFGQPLNVAELLLSPEAYSRTVKMGARLRAARDKDGVKFTRHDH